jgi:hypothetical protein
MRMQSTSSAIAMIAPKANSSALWKMTRSPGINPTPALPSKGDLTHVARTRAWDRPTAGFQFVGPANPEDAKRFGII